MRNVSSTVLNLSNGSSEGKRGTGTGKVHLMKYTVSVYYGIYDGKSGRNILVFPSARSLNVFHLHCQIIAAFVMLHCTLMIHLCWWFPRWSVHKLSCLCENVAPVLKTIVKQWFLHNSQKSACFTFIDEIYTDNYQHCLQKIRCVTILLKWQQTARKAQEPVKIMRVALSHVREFM